MDQQNLPTVTLDTAILHTVTNPPPLALYHPSRNRVQCAHQDHLDQDDQLPDMTVGAATLVKDNLYRKAPGLRYLVLRDKAKASIALSLQFHPVETPEIRELETPEIQELETLETRDRETLETQEILETDDLPLTG
ncbi:hypothetical protein N7520_002851 [Penicillium odoratum]|uniref:uncharacterized protein n=1 Tax=Penicillium odoratum TaxID=1167516 RepID=UPI002546E301|nr:uncharacterized protein N7520_002851 [Penicillium odoratum]KAJ5772322.1 hypothetical protein N7520_002851 [Penicillium odoratum]